MASTAGTLVDVLSERLRDPNNTVHTRASLRDLLARCQVALNIRRSFVVETALITVDAGQALVSVDSELPGIAKVTEIEVAAQALDLIEPWRDLWKLSKTWLFDRADSPDGWARIGRTLVAIYPTPNKPLAVTVKGAKLTNPLDSDASILDFRVEDEDLVRDLTLAIALFSQTDIDMVEPLLQRLIQRLQIESTLPAGKAR